VNDPAREKVGNLFVGITQLPHQALRMLPRKSRRLNKSGSAFGDFHWQSKCHRDEFDNLNTDAIKFVHFSVHSGGAGYGVLLIRSSRRSPAHADGRKS
jgi:hypothetical protein